MSTSTPDETPVDPNTGPAPVAPEPEHGDDRERKLPEREDGDDAENGDSDSDDESA